MKKILMSLLCLMMVVTLTACGKKNTDNKQTTKEEEDTLATTSFDDQTVEDLIFENFTIVPDGDNQVVFFTITNNTNSDIYVKTVNLTLYSEKATVLSMPEYINKVIASGESIDITETYEVNLSNVDEVKYEVTK